MPGATITVDVGPLVQYLTDLESNQIPFATSRAVNDLAIEVQTAMRAGIQERFIIRREWVLQGVQVSKYSTKRDDPIMATIRIAPDRDFLFKFEAGGERFPRVGANIAVPTDSVRGSRRGTIPSGMRPKAFGFRETTTKSGKTQIKGNQRTFIISTGATPGIYQRTSSNAIRLLYQFFHSVPVPMSLHFQETAQKVCTARFVEIFRKRLREALATAK